MRLIHRSTSAALSLVLAFSVTASAAAQQPSTSAAAQPAPVPPDPQPPQTPAPPPPTPEDSPPAATPTGTIAAGAPPSPSPPAANTQVQTTGAPSTDATQIAAPEEKPPPLPPIPLNRLYVASLTVVRYNPLGLETQNRLVFQRRLMDSKSILFRDTFASAAASLKLNPAFLKIGPTVELQPLALVNLRAGYEFLYYFGSFGFLRSYPEAPRDFADATRKTTEDAAYNTSGHHVFIEPTLQAKVKSVALRSKLAIEYWSMNLNDGDRVFYDATLDTQVPNKGWVIANDTDLVYSAGQLTFGARFSGVWPLYNEGHFGAAGEPASFGGNSHMRLGPLVGYSFNTKEYSSFNKPTLLAIAGWYLDHPNREGALPYMLLGFSFSSDLLSYR